MVPNGWKKEFLGDVAQFSQGVQVDAELQSEIKDDGLIRFLRISDYVNPNEVPRYISKPSDKYIVNKTDLSMIRYGSAGAGDLVRGLEGAIANNLFRVIPNENLLSKDFFWFYAHQPVVKNFLFSNSTSSTMPAISFKLVSKLPLLLPPLPEQQKIAKILTTWDKAIDTTERLIDNSKQQKKALMQQLLTGKKRLLDDNGERFEGEWDEYTLEQAATYRRGSFPQPYGDPRWVDEVNGYPFVQVYDIDKNMKLKSETKIKISDAAIDKSVFIPKDTIVVSLQGSIGRVAITQYDAYVDRTILLFQEFLKPMSKVFFAYIIQELFDIEKTKAPGGTIKTITKAVLSNFRILTPSLEEQQKIAAVLTNADKEIDLLEQQLADLQQEKKALMQVLLTGKKRVVVDGEAV